MLGWPAWILFHLGLSPLSCENAGGGHHFDVQEENRCLLYSYRPDPNPLKSPKPQMSPNPSVTIF